MSKHAYLIMAHNDWSLLDKLLRCIDDPRNAVFIHVDRKVLFPLSEIYVPQKAECSYIHRSKVSWGGYSQIKAELDLLEEAVKHRCTYYHLLSGQDLPIKTQDYIHSFFDNQNGENNYIGFSPKEVYSNMAMVRLAQYHFLQEAIGRNSGRWIAILNRLESKSLNIQKKLKINRVAHYPFEICKGTNWFSINHELAQYVVSRKSDIEKHFKNSICADELFLQTISQDSPFRDKIINNTLRAIDWKRGQPYTYRKEDYLLLMESDKLFARKFSTNVDSEIIDMVCNSVAPNKTVL